MWALIEQATNWIADSAKRTYTISEDRLGLNLIPILVMVGSLLLIQAADIALVPAAEAKPLTCDEKNAVLKTATQVDEVASAKFQVRDISARLLWVVADFAQFLALVLAIAFLWKTVLFPPQALQKPGSGDSTRAYIRTSLAVIFAVLVGLCVFAEKIQFKAGAPKPFNLQSDLLETAQNKLGMQRMGKFTNVCNGLAAALIVSGTFACSATLAHPKTIEDKLSLFKDQVSTIRELLSICSVALIVGIIQINLEYRWLAAVVVPRLQKTAIEAADSLSVAAGTIFSILMVALFGSTAIVVRRRIRRLPWSNVDFSLRDFYVQSAKALAPLWTAALSAVLHLTASG